MNEKVQLEKTLGLPPMELAEGTTYIKRESGSNIAQKCFHPWLKRALQTVLLTACAVGTFVVLLRLLHSTDSNNKSKEIIVVTGLRDSPNITVQQHNFEIILQLGNKTSNRSRRKRSITSKQDLLATFKLHEEVVKKARNIVMNHDKPCNSDTQDSICRDLVHKLDLVTKKRSAGHTNEGLKNHEDVLTSAKESDSVEDVNHEGDHIMDANEGEDHHDHGFQARSQYPGPAYPDPGPSYPIVAPAPIADTCLLARLLKHNPQQLHGVYDVPPSYIPHSPVPVPYQQIPPPYPEYGPPAYHVPYHGRAVSDVQEHEDHNVHPQDIEILRSHTTTPRITLTNESLSSTREADCPLGSVSCEDGGSCVAQKQWCDGLVDCADASDEARCTCKARVDKSRLCDGYYDCPFGEDEMGCFGCSEDTFSCEDLDLNSRSSCFSREQRCDNTADCPNRKDELECNLLAPSLHDKPMFAVSNTEGFLQRNFRGTWFPVCNNPYMWAHDACRRETGLIIRPPYIQMVPIDPRLKVTYLNTGPGGVQMSDSCVNSSAVYVTCPDLLCGTRVLTTPQFLRENAAFENHLFGRNKRFLLRNPRYPIVYFNRSKRHVNNTFSRNSVAEENVPYIDGGIRGWRDKRAETRVVGGRPSQPAAWPWMIALYRNGMFHCGGVVISQKWVVSAAHCVHKFWEHYYEIQVGMLRRFSFSPQESNHRVTHVIVNQHYDRVDMKNDLSLLRVTPSIQFSRWVRPICLPGPDTAGPDWKWGPPLGTSCVAVGWGATVEHGPDPDHMREVEVPIWGQCKHREDRAGKEICAGPVEGGKDACQGDSGGPLLCRNPLNAQQWYMAGIVSHGDGCARKGEPGVYTRVSLFVKWIKFHIFSKTLPGIQPKQECPGFKCISGIAKCLPKKRMCDKIIDCLDGEDEMNCNFDSPLHGADKNMFISENTVEKRNNFETKEAETESPTVKDTTQGFKDIIEDTDISETKSIHTVSHQATMRDNLDSAGTVSRGDIETISISVTKDPLESRSMMIDSQKKNEELRESDIPENFDDFTTTITTQSPEKNSITTISDTTEDFSQSVEQETQSVENESQEIGIKNPQTKSTTEKIHAEHDSDSTEEKDHSKERKINKKDQEATDTTTTDSSSVANTDLIDSTTQKSIITTRSETDDLDDKESKTFSLDLPLDESDLTNNHHVNKHDQNSDLSSEPESKSIVDKVKGLVLAKYLVPANIKKKHRVPKFFECRRINQSIPYHHRCNHKADCEDGTDELDCSCVDYVTTFDEKLICDGVVDCADGHDELNCYSCADDHFLCKKSQTCLPLSFVCDKKPQCPQGEDELDCFALSNGKNIEIDFDGRPKVALEGYITRRNRNNWNIVCEDKLSFDRQEAAASHICRYLGFSAANSYHVKYINIKDEILTESNTDFRRKRDASTVPISFMYRTAEEDSDKARNIVIRDPQVIKEQCVPNITKTCMSLYVSCELNLYSDFTEFYEIENDLSFRQADGKAVRRLWPWVAKVFVEGEYRCTGVLVDLSWVLVSHSCLWDSMLIQNYITVVLGAQRTLKATHGPYEQIYQVNVTFDHVDVTRLLKDIVLLKSEITEIRGKLEASELASAAMQRELLSLHNADAAITATPPPAREVQAQQNKSNATDTDSRRVKDPPPATYAERTRDAACPLRAAAPAPLRPAAAAPSTTRSQQEAAPAPPALAPAPAAAVEPRRKLHPRSPRRRNRNKSGTAPAACSLKAATPTVDIYVSRIHANMAHDNIMRYIKERSVGRTEQPVQVLAIERLQSAKQTDFKSFRLRVPADQQKVLLDRDFWPAGIVFRRYREAKQTMKPPDNSARATVGQDDNNKTVSVFLKETEESCDLHSKCFKRHKPELICPADMKSRRSWSGIVSCHSARGWAPAASFVETGGECGFGDSIVGVDVDNLRSEIKHASGKALSTSTEQVTTDACDGIRCRRGKCIKFSRLCDDVRDCEDGYDESDTACMKKQTVCEEDPHHRGCECTSGQMKCKNGRCIAKELFGDGNNDCYDGSDEPGRVVTCAQYLSRVMPLRLCDGILHCDDKSDEDPMFCKCFSKKSYKCGSTEHCVAPDLVCDGSPDCPHKEDEATCMAISAPEGTPYGTGEVIVRSHGVWHSKCYPKENHTRSELEDICRQLGFISGHAKQLKVGQKSTFHPVTKVVLEPFTEVVLNNNTRIKLRNSDQPLARAVVNEDLENCYPVYIECL
ncbi:unnamed protein product [Plutella xylostella]|uniref:(diamondback moth) hypothetical protein n=1 Tax=Plutella xylostella TaxID=51655 RepID=A0A8S4FZI9_PLUXY|nr:unnamed protein product [Plutella xylostella]